MPENSAADTDVGAAVTASDDDGDTLAYTLEGTDAASFAIVSTSGQIQTVTGVDYNHEATKNSYSVTVTASDGTDNDSIDVTITVTDVDEEPDKPAKPTVTAVSGSSTSLDVSWTEPGLNGGPAIIGYGVRFESRASGTTIWSTHAWSHTGTATTTTLTDREANQEHRVRVQAVNGETPSAWSDYSDVVSTNAETTTGICDRTQQVHENIVDALSGVDDCAAVTDADLAGITALSALAFKKIDSLKPGDFAGLTSLTELGLAGNSLTMLPADVFSGLTAVTTLGLNKNDLESLPADVFSGLTSLTDLSLALNSLTMLPADVFSGLTVLTTLNLSRNDLESLPNGLFSGLTALTTLTLSGNPTDPLLLTVTVEKVGTDQARARVLAGAPFAVDIPVTVANGALAGGAAALGVVKGSVDGGPVTVTRTAGTTAAVTVDVDLTNQPALPSGHTGYVFARASSGLPATVLPDTTSTDPGDADGGPPTVTSVAVVSAPRSGNTYRLYETMRFAVTFSHPVQVDKPGPLRLEVGLDVPGGGSGSTVEAVFSGQSRSPTAATPQISLSRYLHFHYKVQLFDRDADGVRIGANALRLASEAFAYKARILSEDDTTDAELDHAAVGPLSGHKVDGSADVSVIEGIEVVSTPRLLSRGADEADTYGEDEIIRIEVRFDDSVQVEGEPTFALEVGDPCVSVCEAHYESGSGTDTLVFAYLVLEVDHDHNGIAIPADPIEAVYGDSIRNDAGHEANLSHSRKGTQRGHKTDGSRTAPSYFSVEDAEAHESDGKMEFTVRLEPHGLSIVTVDYATADGTGNNAARAGSDYTETSGTLRFNSLETERTVSVPITDDAHEDDGETFTLTLSNPGGATLRSGDAEATGTIRNSDPEVGLSAVFPASAFASASHGGADDRPQAVVAFSEAVAEFGADTPSVSVTGGTVASVQPHAEDGQEHAWIFFLAPDGDGAVTFALVADAACAAGGICTSGGKALTEVPAAATIPGPEETAEPALTASFEDMPEAHDGESAFRFGVAFSEDIGIGYQSLRDDAFTVSGGEVTGAQRVDGRNDLWQITVEPDSDPDVTITLPAGRDCQVSGAICTRGENRRQLSNSPSATVAGPPNTAAAGAPTISGTPQVGEELTASTSGISDADGLDDASFAYQWMRAGADIGGATGATYTPVDADEGERLTVRVSFTDDAGNDESLTSAATDAVAAAPPTNTAAAGAPTISGTPQVGEALTASTSGISDADGLDTASFAYQWMRAGADIQGATGSSYTPVDADEGERLTVRVSFTDDAGNEESLTSAATDAVAAAPEPLTASFEGMPAEHAGQGSFSFRVAFSDGINISYKTVRDASFTVTAGEVTQASRVDRRRDLWKITIEPDSDGAVSVRLPETTDCGARGDLHRRRPAAVALAVGDGGRPGGHRGGRRAGG